MQRLGASDGFARWQIVVARNIAEAEERALERSPILHHKLTDKKEPNVCALCGGARLVRKEVPWGHADFGGKTECPACGDKVFIHTDAKRILLPSEYWRMTFDTWLSRSHHSGRALSVALRMVADRTGFLYLCGTPGTGKTHLAAAIANRLMDQSYPARFTTAVDLAAATRSAVGSGSNAVQSTIDSYVKARFLIIDDLGTEHGTGFVRDVLYRVIDARYRTGAPFVITSNYLPEALGEDRLASRLRDVSSGSVYEMYELDYRANPIKEAAHADTEETF